MGTTRTIVGIVNDVKANAVAGGIVPVQIYVPYAQSPAGRVTIIAKTTSGYEARLAANMKAALLRIDPKLVVGAYAARDLIDLALASDRFMLVVLSSYASVALAMAALGITGLVVYTVTQRTREIGIRIALGATPARVVRTVTQRSLMWCAAGMAAGTAASFAIARALAGSYYEFSDIDPFAIVAACVVLAVVAFTASYLPARRAARVDPAITLRAE